MRTLSEDQFVSAVKIVAIALVEMAERTCLAPDDAANVIGAACGEALAQKLGHFAAITRLRDVADVLERQILEAD